MKNLPLNLLFLVSFIGLSQNQKSENINALSKKGAEIEVNFTYIYSIKTDKADDEMTLIPIVRTSVRGIIGTYSTEELYLKSKDEISLEVFRDLMKWKELTDKYKIEEFFINEFKLPHLTELARKNGLLKEFDNLSSSNRKTRKQALNKLFEIKTKSSYYLILDHWSKETDQDILNLILLKMIE